MNECENTLALSMSAINAFWLQAIYLSIQLFLWHTHTPEIQQKLCYAALGLLLLFFFHSFYRLQRGMYFTTQTLYVVRCEGRSYLLIQFEEKCAQFFSCYCCYMVWFDVQIGWFFFVRVVVVCVLCVCISCKILNKISFLNSFDRLNFDTMHGTWQKDSNINRTATARHFGFCAIGVWVYCVRLKYFKNSISIKLNEFLSRHCCRF